MKRLLVPFLALIALLVGCEHDPGLAYLDDGEVYLWLPGADQPRPLTDRDDVDRFFWSPSGRHIAYRVAKPFGESFWCFTGVDSGVEVKTRSVPLFSAAGRAVAYIKDRDQQLLLLDETGGEQKLIAEWVWQAQWNSAGTMLAYVEEGDLKVFDLESGTSRYLADGVAEGPDFVADDLVLFISDDNTLTAARADGSAIYRLVEEVSGYYVARDYSDQVRGARLVCVDRDRDAYLMDFDGADRIRTGTDFHHMAWDATGSRYFLIEEKKEKRYTGIFSASGEELLEVKEPWEPVAAETLAWSSGSDELAYIGANGSLYVMDLGGAQMLVAKDVYDFAWVPHRRQLVVLMPRTVTGEKEKIEEVAEEAAEEELEIDLEEEVVEEKEEPAPAAAEIEEGIEEEGSEEEVEVEIVEPVGEEIIVEEGTEESPEETVEVEEPETAVYLYDLDGKPRRMLSRSGRLPLLSPRGNRLLFVEPLREGLYNAVIGSLDEEEEHYLGKFRVPIFPAAWQPEGRAIEGRLLGVIVTLALVAAGVVVIYLVIRRIWLRRKVTAQATAETVANLEDAI
ncbi:hypothetical protein KAU45_02015 [bacterium]|nr:hypothetical protein [bacterium]